MFEEAATSLCSVGGMSNEFSVSVGLHQGSTLSPYIFALVMDELTKPLQDDRMMSRVLCDKKMPGRLKGKCYKTIVRPAMLYGSKCWATTGQHTHKMVVAEMHILLQSLSFSRFSTFCLFVYYAIFSIYPIDFWFDIVFCHIFNLLLDFEFIIVFLKPILLSLFFVFVFFLFCFCDPP
ncbi:hypothetical protein UlMin_009044 [Ulmus minor]